MYEKTNFNPCAVFVLTMQRYGRFPTPANLFSELGIFFSECLTVSSSPADSVSDK